MSARLEVRVRWLLRTLALLLATLAVLLSARPETPDGAGAALGGEAAVLAAVAGGLLALAGALAALAGQAPRRFAHLMPLLALGATFCAALVGWRAPGHARLVAGALALGVAPLAAWLALWLDERPSEATAARDAALARALVATAVADDGPVAAAVPADRLAAAGMRALVARAPRGRTEVRLALRALDLASLVARRRGFSALEPAARSALVERLGRAPLPALRRRAADGRLALLEAIYAEPEVERAIGLDRERLEARLALGPNREAHAARLAALRAAPLPVDAPEAGASGAVSAALGADAGAAPAAAAPRAAAAPGDASPAARDAALPGALHAAPAAASAGSALPRRSLVRRIADAGAGWMRRGPTDAAPAGEGPVRP